MLKNIVLTLGLFLAGMPAFSQVSFSDTIIIGGVSRDYLLYVPAVYDGTEPVPLLLNLHGYGSQAFEQFYYADFKPIADTANFIIALPNGTFDGFGLRYWNCFTSDGIGVDDVQFLSELIDTISAAYNIDANRIYSTGMSNGGFMSYTLAGELSNRIAAIASVTGSIDLDRFPAFDPQHAMPVMEIHGTADDVVPYDGTADFMAVSDIVEYWVDHNNCITEPSIFEIEDINIFDGCTAERYVYSGGINNADVEHYKILGGGHTWPGTAFFYLGVTNLDFNASKVIWDFFSRYSLDVLSPVETANSNMHKSISAYPNPAVDHIYLDIKPSEVIALAVYNIAGEQMHAHWFYLDTSIKIETQGWEKGIYSIQCLTEQALISATVLVL
jgi:polyhydroxybutyrate depolymerase